MEADRHQWYPQITQGAQGSASRPITAPDGSIRLVGVVRAPDQGVWDGLQKNVRRLTSGHGPLLALLLIALGVVLFGFRSRRGRRTTTP
ncbi:hypothetical protein ABZ829_35975 [Streptomyces xanthochromogenes]|uniref:hypothetical protein n=1 Tax=Streptomyces xanthochromogenes TaxID=67384 RepID=UPI003413245F